MLTGGCLCGAVRYEIDGQLRHITHCHCAMCRKVHGAAFATYGRLAKKRLRVTGAEALRRFSSSDRVTRSFCGTCGSQLFWSHEDHPDALSITLGTLESDPGGRPIAHIYARDRAAWFEITDALPRHDEDVP